MEKEKRNIDDIDQEVTHTSFLTDIIENLRKSERNFDSPINLNIALMKTISLPELYWYNYDVTPKKVKLTNSGHTVIYSGRWFGDRPFISGGPFIGNYVFSQMHFHWGQNDMEGSEHTADGVKYPIELHAVHFKSSYMSQEAALREKDGVMILVYFYKLQSTSNPSVQFLLDEFSRIQKSSTSVRLESIPMEYFIRPFLADYFIYWGSIKTSSKPYTVLWVISRMPLGISAEQSDLFRTLLNENDEPMIRNFRNIELTDKKLIYHVNPSGAAYSTLLPVPWQTDKYRMLKHEANKEEEENKAASNNGLEVESKEEN